jgi:Tfp pilus assembly protein PilO
MKENDNSHILLALLGGVAVGVAIGYFLNSDKKDELIDDLKESASKIKNDFAEKFEQGKTIFEDLKNSAGEQFNNTSA